MNCHRTIFQFHCNLILFTVVKKYYSAVSLINLKITIICFLISNTSCVLKCVGGCLCGFCNVKVCVCVGFVMCGFCYVWVCICGFCKVNVCIFECFVICGCEMCGFCNVCVCVCVGFLI